MSYDPEPGASPEEQNLQQDTLEEIRDLLRMILKHLEIITEQELEEDAELHT